jgi:predicted acylesterase/phospholipase RssA
VSQNAIGIALAGGGPLGAIYEIGALVALQEALAGVDFTACDVYVGVSSGAFLATGLANGLPPRAMYEMFIESEAADDPFEPDMLLQPALGEYGRRLAALPGLLLSATRSYLAAPYNRGFFESFQRLARALPTGIFDNARIGQYLRKLAEAPGRTDDFRKLRHKLLLVATELDTAEPVAFGSPGWDHVPISLAVQASSALPGLFPPVEIGGRHYVDGALTKTLHASLALGQGAKLLICINPIVPFDAAVAGQETGGKPIALVDGGLPAVIAQTFRSIIHSRMVVGMSRYEAEFPDADVVLFEPSRGDAELFFTNVFSYAERGRLSAHAYQCTRAELLRRYEELSPIFERHGVSIRRSALLDAERQFAAVKQPKTAVSQLMSAAEQLRRTLQRLDALLRACETDEQDAADPQ